MIMKNKKSGLAVILFFLGISLFVYRDGSSLGTDNGNLAFNVRKKRTAPVHLSKSGKRYVACGINTIKRIHYSSSSFYGPDYTARKVIDNDYKTKWISRESGDQWVEIDFGSKRMFNKISVYPSEIGGTMSFDYFILQFKYRGRWIDHGRYQIRQKKSFLFFSWTSHEKVVDIHLRGVDASLFRVYIPRSAINGRYAAISEIETYLGSTKMTAVDGRLLKLLFPIEGGFLPRDEANYPGALRGYRGGVHKGIDVHYYYDRNRKKTLAVSRKTPVLAADDGVVIRADHDYRPMTAHEWREQSEYYQINPRTFVMKSFGGIQVWIDHGNGIVTAYNHLSKVDPDVRYGKKVSRGTRIGWVGNSGLMGEIERNDRGLHLHFEIWVDGEYLGHGMSSTDSRFYFSLIFPSHKL